jgi:SsrA-binding protein
VLPVSRRGDQLVITNRKARHDYHVLDTWEAGIMLAGPEVKSMREGRANLQDAYARIDDDELWLLGMHVSPYAYSREDLDPVRKRKLLLHRKEITEIERALSERGTTLVPLRVYFKDGRAKVELALARGKKTYDKRQALAAKQANREKQQALGRQLKGRA